MIAPSRWWPLTQSQARYGISRSTIYRLIAEHLIEARKVGKLVLVNDDSMDRYIASQPMATIKSDDRSAKLAEQHNGAKRRYTRKAKGAADATQDQHITKGVPLERQG
jgi:excisionase family DNA binding protein